MPASRLVPVRVVILSVLLVSGAECAYCDGGFFGKGLFREQEPVSSPGQKAVLIRDGGTHEILLVQTTYRGLAADFAWVIPVPGRPLRTDVFPANPQVFDALDQQTRPETRVMIEDPFATAERGFTKSQRQAAEAPTGAGAMGGAPGPEVVVHDRMEVGDYSVTILSATGPGVLVDWLNRNGYGFPKTAEAIADDYVERDWTFVAFRIRPQVQRRQTTLSDVAPVGIRFPTEQLVYPLAFSRVSAPETTTILLLIVDDSGVECAELPTVTFPAATKPARGVTYHSLARELLAKHQGEAVLCEARFALPTWSPVPLNDLALAREEALGESQRVATRPGAPAPPPDLKKRALTGRVATRLWAELPRAAMEDLTFRPTSHLRFSLRVDKTATLPTPRWLYLFGPGLARLGWTAALLGLVVALVWPRQHPAVSSDAIEEAAWRAAKLSAMTLVGLVVLTIGVGKAISSLDPSFGFLPTDDTTAFVVGFLLACLWVVPALFIDRELLRRIPREAALRAVPGMVVAVLLLLLAAGWLSSPFGWRLRHGSLGVVPLLGVPGFLAVLLLGWPLSVVLALRGGRTPQLLGVLRTIGLSLLALIVIAPTVNRACGRLVDLCRPNSYAVRRQQEDATAQLRTTLQMFRDATGAYPRRLTDLALGKLPATGIDGSGNEVRLSGSPAMPLLPALPVDPLTGRSDTWLYDVRSPLLVESGAYEVVVNTVGR
jgi:hypothetical protein